MRVAVPHLRIVDQALWASARRRRAALDAAAKPAADGSTFRSMQRATYLLSKLIHCGSCGGGFSVLSATHLGCSNSRNKGRAICANRRTVKRVVVEAKVLDALSSQLMAPEVYAAFVRGFTAEWSNVQKGRAVEQEGQHDELRRLGRRSTTPFRSSPTAAARPRSWRH